MSKQSTKKIWRPKNIPEILFTTSRNKLYKNKKFLTYDEGKHYRSLTFFELRNEIVRAALALEKLGVKKGNKALIVSENRPEWVIIDGALMLIGAVSVPIHKNMLQEQVSVVVGEVGAKLAFVSDKAALSILSKCMDKIDKIVMFEKQKITAIRANTKIKYFYFHDLMMKIKINNKATNSWMRRIKNIDENDVLTVVYTSGTTGKPKGARLTHGNFISMIMGKVELLGPQPGDRYLSILPLSHVFERAMGIFATYTGCSIKYCNNINNFSEEMVRYQPTILIGAPRLYEKVHDKIISSVNAKPISRLLFKVAMSSDESSGRLIKKLSNKVFSAVKGRLGGKIRIYFSGSASLDPGITKFFRRIGMNIAEGYGLTETAATIAVDNPYDIKIGTVGKAFKNMDIKIADDGEIVVKGTSLMAGYVLKEDEEGAFTKDGYFKTGDLGSIDKEGYITILGRKKDIQVLSTGENIAPAVIERALLKSLYIDQVLIIGDGHKHISAIIVINTEEVKKKLDINVDDILNDDRVENLINNEVLRVTSELPRIQQIQKYILTTQPFTIENNQLSASMKPKRQEIMNFYAKEIKELYTE